MANMYLRVPHYVASYLRNKDRSKPLEVGSVIALNSSERLWVDFSEGLYPNLNQTISRAYCFCQKQWNTMMDGYSLTDKKTGKRKKVLTERFDQLTLDDKEVQTLTGLRVPRGDDSGEYICIAVPRDAIRYGKVVPTNAFWQLQESAANAVRTHLVNEFWRTLYAYVDKARDKAEVNGRPFVFIEVLESFMERYDITCSPDMHERAALKRNYNRRRTNYKFTEEDYIEHG